mmetsp:Transcript_18814/g.31343  ORF Transcript_18814/g.31343 Transcript_18814/m.31343 type:complete len:620 (-) Transcript_18814:1241-3100(-)
MSEEECGSVSAEKCVKRTDTVLGYIHETVHCKYCHIDISEKPRIRCAECVTPFDLCGDCFSSGVELFPHTNNHSYRVIDCLQKPLFTKDWTALEDLKLLNGIDKFGLGNWKLISDFIGTKSARACDEHYWDYYLGRFGRCLPSTTIVGEESVPTVSLLAAAADLLAPELQQEGEGDGTGRDDTAALQGVLLERQQALVNLPPPEATATGCAAVGSAVERFKGAGRDGSGTGGGGKAGENKKEQEIRDRISQMPGADLAGFMPIRKDFDIEHDNEAEHLLTDLEFLSSDYPSETAMKLSVARAYNHRLHERNLRKSFAIERGLVDIKKQQMADRRRSKEDKAMLAHLKVFSRFQTEEQAALLSDGVAVVRRLKKQIEAFKQYRQMGIRTLEQARAFEVDRKKREHQVKASRSKQMAAGIRDASYSFSTAQSELVSCLASSSSSSSSAAEQDVQRARALVKEAPHSSLLSEAELDLCARTGLLPLHYVAVQEALVRESFRNGTLTMEGLRRVVKVQNEEQLDAKATRRSYQDASSSGGKRKAFFDVHKQGISADAAVKLFDFFVENASYGGVGISTKAGEGPDSSTDGVVDSSSVECNGGTMWDADGTSRQSKRMRNMNAS